MHEMEETYPGYGFARHKGYGTRLHYNSLKLMGVAPVHRKSFAPIKAAMLGQFSEINEIALEELAEEELIVA
jgi:ribonuclease HII